MTTKKSALPSWLYLALWGAVLLVGLGATALYLLRPPAQPIGLFGGTFSLASTNGETFTEQNLVGTPSLVFFGYTFCPDVCPTTLYEATGWRQQLGLSADELRIIFVSVDPERDTIDQLKTYLSSYAPDIIGLSGTDAETEAAKKAFGVYSKKQEDASSTDYLVDHTASVFLIDRNGHFQGTVSYGEAADTAKAKISRLVEIR